MQGAIPYHKLRSQNSLRKAAQMRELLMSA